VPDLSDNYGASSGGGSATEELDEQSLITICGGNLRRTREREYERKAEEATPTVKRNRLIAIWCMVKLRLGKEVETVYSMKSNHCQGQENWCNDKQRDRKSKKRV
jgi:hypothetical protein